MSCTGFLKWICKAAAAAVCSTVILSLFVLLIRCTGIHITSSDGATDYTWEPYQLKTTVTEGFAWLRMDENGYNNSFAGDNGTDSERDVDILLMGSSHMEALQVASDENTGYLLNELLPELYTYNIGMSGHTIYTCVSNLAAAQDSFQPEYILLETDTVELDVSEMQAVIDGTYPDLPSYDSGLLYYLQKYIPAAKALYQSLGEWSSAGSTASAAPLSAMTVSAAQTPAASSQDYADVLHSFLSSARADSAESTLILFYQPTIGIDADGNPEDSTNPEDLALFEAACRDCGIVFVDMTEAFLRLYEEDHRLAHGFSNTAVGVGHLNRDGHRVVAETLADVIRGLEEG